MHSAKDIDLGGFAAVHDLVDAFGGKPENIRSF
jgi:hypothetical protein